MTIEESERKIILNHSKSKLKFLHRILELIMWLSFSRYWPDRIFLMLKSISSRSRYESAVIIQFYITLFPGNIKSLSVY